MTDETKRVDDTTRRTWLGVLARAPREALEDGLQRLAPGLRYEFLRRPEQGMVMLRARMGGTGDPFNLGEATVARCTVRLPAGHIGTGHVLGRDLRQAELVAVFDGLLQDAQAYDHLQQALVQPLAEAQQQRRDAAARSAAATRVEFLTMVRGA